MMWFDGKTYDPELDGARLSQQIYLVWAYMSDYEWHSLSEISKALGFPEASISARLRDFRKDRFGGHEIQRMRTGEGGTFLYRVVPNLPKPEPKQFSLLEAIGA